MESNANHNDVTNASAGETTSLLMNYSDVSTSINSMIDTTTTYGTSTIEEGDNDMNSPQTVDIEDRQQQQETSADQTTTNATTEAANGDEEENNNNDDDNSTTDGDGEETRDGAIGTLTRRLRCLFSTITWPIVPLGTIVALALLWVLYAASSSDLKRSCSHPLHWYALASLILVAYIPHHAQVRSHLFQYSRERDGPIRPARVRMYDQFFHTVCLLYVYSGVTLIQTCREDIITNSTDATDTNDLPTEKNQPQNQEEQLTTLPGDGPMNTCEATCPNLYQALSVYVATLELFTFALILPLLFLPCIYLWFLRRATAEAEAFAQLQDRLQEEEALLSNGGVTASEILDSLENVKLVSRTSQNNDGDEENGGSERQVWLLPSSATDPSIGTNSTVKECCICMSDFPIQDEADLEDGLFQEQEEDPAITDTASSSSQHSEDAPSATGSIGPKYKGMVRTRCGHVFHKECLSGWVGGRWQLSSQPSSNNNDDDAVTGGGTDDRRRRARQTCCPLCREDLRPPAPS